MKISAISNATPNIFFQDNIENLKLYGFFCDTEMKVYKPACQQNWKDFCFGSYGSSTR